MQIHCNNHWLRENAAWYSLRGLGPSNSTTAGFCAQKMADAMAPTTIMVPTTMTPALPPRPLRASAAEVALSVYSCRGSIAKMFDLPCTSQRTWAKENSARRLLRFGYVLLRLLKHALHASMALGTQRSVRCCLCTSRWRTHTRGAGAWTDEMSKVLQSQ